MKETDAGGGGEGDVGHAVWSWVVLSSVEKGDSGDSPQAVIGLCSDQTSCDRYRCAIITFLGWRVT